MDSGAISPVGDMMVSVPGLMSVTLAGAALPPPDEHAASAAPPASAPKPLRTDLRLNAGELLILVYSSHWNVSGESRGIARTEACGAPAGTWMSVVSHVTASRLATAP